MADLRPLDLSPGGLEELARFLRLVFPKAAHLDTRYLRWLYCENPEGPAWGRNAWSGAQLVAHIACVPYRALVFGVEERGGMVCHASTRPDHEGQGLYVKLVRASCAEAAAAGRGFLIGVSNELSTQAAERYLAFRYVGSIEARIGVGAPPAPGDAPIDHFQRLWSGESLRWRLTCPSRSYAREARRPDTVLAASGWPGIRVEMGSFPELQRELPPLPRGAGVLRVWLGFDPRRGWQGHRYREIPARLRLAPLNFMYHDLTGRDRRLERSRVFFRGVDFDAY